MNTVVDTFYKPGERTTVFDSDKEAMEVAATKLERLQRVLMHQLRQLKDVAPERAQEDALKRHVAETGEIIRGLRARAKH